MCRKLLAQTGWILGSCLVSLLVGCEPIYNSMPSQPATNSQPAAGSDSAASTGSATSTKATAALADLGSLESSIKDSQAEFVVVDVWSTSCLPCMKEFPHLVELSKRWPDRVKCVSFNVDYIGIKSKQPDSYQSKVEEFLTKQNATSVTNLISTLADSDVFASLEIESIPAILIYDAKGNVVQKFTDASSGDDGLSYDGDVIPAIEKLLK